MDGWVVVGWCVNLEKGFGPNQRLIEQLNEAPPHTHNFLICFICQKLFSFFFVFIGASIENSYFILFHYSPVLFMYRVKLTEDLLWKLILYIKASEICPHFRNKPHIYPSLLTGRIKPRDDVSNPFTELWVEKLIFHRFCQLEKKALWYKGRFRKK